PTALGIPKNALFWEGQEGIWWSISGHKSLASVRSAKRKTIFRSDRFAKILFPLHLSNSNRELDPYLNP
ncbi:hypothetical protein AB2U02_21140, partial [Clostridium butyricum]|uniref:hypothetical protein n=1 Tax=Clostridium butyricum TaxID=1492 RepID=UPI003465568A